MTKLSYFLEAFELSFTIKSTYQGFSKYLQTGRCKYKIEPTPPPLKFALFCATQNVMLNKHDKYLAFIYPNSRKEKTFKKSHAVKGASSTPSGATRTFNSMRKMYLCKLTRNKCEKKKSFQLVLNRGPHDW